MKILIKSKTRHIYLVQKFLLQGELSYYIKKLHNATKYDIICMITCLFCIWQLLIWKGEKIMKKFFSTIREVFHFIIVLLIVLGLFFIGLFVVALYGASIIYITKMIWPQMPETVSALILLIITFVIVRLFKFIKNTRKKWKK